MDNTNNANPITDNPEISQKTPINAGFSTSPSPAAQGGFSPASNVPPRALQKKLIYNIDKKDIIFLFVFAVISFLVIRLGALTGFGLGFAVSSTVFLGCAAAFVYDKKAKQKGWYFTLLFLEMLFGASFFFNNDPLIKFFDICALFIVGFMCFNGLSGNALYSDGSYKEVLEGLYSGIIKPFENITVPFSSFKQASKSGKNKSLLGALVGIGVSLPLLIVIVSLLVSSDVAFENLLTKLFSDVIKLVLALFGTILIMPVIYSYALVLRKKATTPEKMKTGKAEGNLSAVPINTVLCVVSAAYVLYIVSQLAYITKAFAFLLPADYTSSRFAREGFFQMLVVAAINLALVWITSVLVKRRENGDMPVFTKILNAFLCLFTLFYIATAFLKMAQYISNFGFTYLRVTTSVFMVMLAVIVVFAFIGLFVKKLPVVRCAVVCVSAALLLLSFADVNSVVSKINYKLYSESKITLDTDDVYKYEANELIKLFSSDNKRIKYAAYKNLNSLYDSYSNSENGYYSQKKSTVDDTLGLSVPKIRENTVLKERASQLKTELEAFEKEVDEARLNGKGYLYYGN